MSKRIIVMLVFLAVSVFVLSFYIFKKTVPFEKQSPKSTDLYIESFITASKKQDPVMLATLLQSAQSEHEDLRQIAAECLGYFQNDQAVAALQKLLLTASPALRIRAIRSFSHHKSSQRLTILQKYLNAGEVTSTEVPHIWAAVIKLTEEPELKASGIGELLKLSSTAENDEVQLSSFNYLLDLWSEASQIHNHIYKIVLETHNLNIIYVGIKRLSRLHGDFLQENQEFFIEHSDPMVRLKFIEVLHVFCPENRKELIVRFLQDNPKFKSKMKPVIAKNGFELVNDFEVKDSSPAVDSCIQ